MKKMNGKSVMQPGDTPTGDDEHQVEVQPVVKGVGQMITIVERGEHPRGRGRGAGSRRCGRGDKDIVAGVLDLSFHEAPSCLAMARSQRGCWSRRSLRISWDEIAIIVFPIKPARLLTRVPHHVVEDRTSLDDELDHLWRLLHPTKEYSKPVCHDAKGILYNPTSSWYAVIVHCLSSGHASGGVRFHQVGTKCECVVRKEEVGVPSSSEGRDIRTME